MEPSLAREGRGGSKNSPTDGVGRKNSPTDGVGRNTPRPTGWVEILPGKELSRKTSPARNCREKLPQQGDLPGASPPLGREMPRREAPRRGIAENKRKERRESPWRKGSNSLARMNPKTLIIIKIMRNLYLSHYFSVTLHCNK